MNQGYLDNGNVNLNVSGFNDDSMISEEDDRRGRMNSNFLIKSSSSINEEKDKEKVNDKLKEKAIQEEFYSHTNSIQSNFEIMSPDGIDLNIPGNDIKNVVFGELFSNAYMIPTNRPSKYSNSRMSYQFVYESKSKITSYKLDSKKFGYSKNNNIITYLLNFFIFSEFTNLEEIEKDKRIKVVFLKKNQIDKKFSVQNSNAILNSLEIPNDKANDFEIFIKGINNYLSETEYMNIQNKKRKKMIFVYAIILIISLLIISIGVILYLILKNVQQNIVLFTVLLSIVLIIFIFGLIYKIIDAMNLKLLFFYYDLKYLLLNYNKIYEHIETWNNNLFDYYKIRAIAPISLNYIMFNLNPYQNIEIKHLDMDWMKKKFYKSPNDIFKKEKEKISYNAIKEKMFPNCRKSSTIN